ncbi:HNH endonuclease signature motif containing protein [Neobacillus sp. NPDC093127]|uniref:HNH endonuclease signature motif containing protein n=1 Tax=Neobacillus sp. NPDC093127 TaxID=3364296 RepID=UPI00382D169B
MPHKYSNEQRDFIREVAPGRYNAEIAELFNKKFGAQVTEGQIKSFKANYKIQSNVPKKRRTEPERLFSKEQVAFIQENVIGLSNQELADLVNRTFNLSVATKQIKAWKNRHRLSSGLKGTEGKAPPNKGTKGLYNVGGNETSFKKGQRPNNYKPVGSERIDQEGYLLIKVSDDGPWHKRWRHKHKVLWEEVNGPIPRGHVLLFADQNKQNLALDNLILITNKQLAVLNRRALIHKDADLTKTGIVIADIYSKISARRKKA